MDEPSANVRPDDADQADRSASQEEAEWESGFRQLTASLETDLTRVVYAASRRAEEALRAAENRGRAMIRQLEEQRRVSDAQQAALAQRVSEIQTSIEGVEEEVQQTRLQADAEAASIVDAARRRADAVVAEAEARAAEIIAFARTRAAEAWVPGEADDADRPPAGSRLRGLSERVGRLMGDAAPTEARTQVPEPPVARPPAPEPPARPETPEPVARPSAPIERPTPAAPVSAPPPPPPPPVSAPPLRAPVVEEPRYSEPLSREPAPRPTESDDDRPTRITPASEVTPPAAARLPFTQQPVVEEEEDELEDRFPVSRGDQAANDEDDEETGHDEAIHHMPTGERTAAASMGPITQTLIFQAVPNFQAALALERSLKAMTEVREVRVADFDERQLTFQVTHELGSQLARVLLAQRGTELELVEARPERVEFVFRS